jgi:hypothetical protein
MKYLPIVTPPTPMVARRTAKAAPHREAVVGIGGKAVGPHPEHEGAPTG